MTITPGKALRSIPVPARHPYAVRTFHGKGVPGARVSPPTSKDTGRGANRTAYGGALGYDRRPPWTETQAGALVKRR